MRWKWWLGTACAMACGSCIFTYDAACFDPPDEFRFVIEPAQARSVERVTAQGDCTVVDPVPDCEAGTCPPAADHTVFTIRWQAHGECTVTASFSDGSAPRVQPYTWQQICPT